MDNMVAIMGELHAYIADGCSIEKIASYKDTMRTVLVQTTECSYFIGDYRKVTQFGRCLPLLTSLKTDKNYIAQRVVVNLVSNADTMIEKFENTFRDLKVGLILGSSLQTAVVSCRTLQKVENVGE